MSELTLARQLVADIISTALPELPVFASPPNAPTAPCVIVSARDGFQSTARLWTQTYRVTVVAPGGDNEAAAQSIETVIWTIALAISAKLAADVSWEPMAQTMMAGQACLMAYVDIVIDVTE